MNQVRYVVITAQKSEGLLREASIDLAVTAFPEAGQIFHNNIETMNHIGHEAWNDLGLAPVQAGKK